MKQAVSLAFLSVLGCVGWIAIQNLSGDGVLAQGGDGPGTGDVAGLSQILLNLDSADETSVRIIAAGQAAGGNSPAYSSTTANEQKIFRGTFVPASNQTQLAIFSDDGCDVTINGVKIHSRLSTGQHLPDLQQSFHVLSYSFTAGQSYQVQVTYSNTIYSGSFDVDGCTLFAFNGGGTTPQWAPGTPPAFTPEQFTIAPATDANGQAAIPPATLYVGSGETITINGTVSDLDRVDVNGIITSVADDTAINWTATAGEPSAAHGR